MPAGADVAESQGSETPLQSTQTPRNETGFVSVCSAVEHSCAVDYLGKLHCWGYGEDSPRESVQMRNTACPSRC
jgi:hypothetical protein